MILRDRLPKTAPPKNASVAEATNNLVVRFLGGTHESVQRWVDSLKIESRLSLFIKDYRAIYYEILSPPSGLSFGDTLT